MVANATLPDGSSLTLVSIYGLFSDRTLNGERYVPTTVHRILSDLTPILDAARNRGRRVIVGGDLNISPQVPAPDTRHHQLVVERIKAFGLVDCLGTKHTDFVRTHRPKNKVSAIPWQDDWIFASESLSLLSCEALDHDAAWELSDHCPIRAEFAL